MDSPWLAIGVLAAMAATAWLLTRCSRLIDGLAAHDSGRYATLDGLRGLLACSVLTHHAVIASHRYAGEPWIPPVSRLYHFAGDGAVALFFMITGFLFWDKALAGRVRFGALMRSRVRRILPLQGFAMLMVTAICMALGSVADPASLHDNLLGVVRWLARGFAYDAQINHVATLSVDAGVTWSLTVEWLFYLLLVPSAVVFRRPRGFVLLVVGVLLLVLIAHRTGHATAYERATRWLPFLGGMGCAYLVRTRVGRSCLRGRWTSVLILALVGLTIAAYHRIAPALLHLALVPVFLAIVLGNDLFGLLRMRAMRWLGQISFSVYLLHGIVLLGALRAVDAFVPVASLTPLGYAALSSGIGVAVVAVASATFLSIERSFLVPSTGRRWAPARRRGTLPAGS